MILKYQNLNFKNKTIFVKAKVKAPFKFSAKMEDEACLYYILNGKASIYSQNKKFTATSDDGLLMECGNYINKYSPIGEDYICEAIGIHLHKDIINEIFSTEIDQLHFFGPKVNPQLIKIGSDLLIKQFIESMNFYFENPELVNDQLINIKIKELILLLTKTNDLEMINTFLSSLFTPLNYNFRSVVESNLYNNINVAELSFLCNMSLSSFKREFKKLYTRSPGQYLKSKRLERAELLISNTDKRITDICFECGFTSPSHFSRCFQKQFGKSPQEYRLTKMASF